ncbi:bactofilin family protein [Azospirillum sp. A39]|uniref:bactofilin family protein n=2 Tax=unclassified Azospirillum TaxID=2630922 RepID=UPI0040459A6E
MAPTLRSPYSDKASDMNTAPPKPPTSPAAAPAFKADIPRRMVDMPGAVPRRPEAAPAAAAPAPAPVAPPPAPAPAATVEQRRLTVGRDISLSGEIASCDVLVVEGTVEAKLRDGRNIEIAESGLFKGSVEIDEADIGGRFEGDIKVRGRLRVRSTGKINGSIRYGELEVEAGGRLIGDIQVFSPAAGGTAAPAAAAPTPEMAPAE